MLPVHPSDGTPRVSLLGRRRASPVSTTAVPTFHAPYAAGFFGAARPRSSPLPWPSSGYTRLGAQFAPHGAHSFDAAGFASCCGPLACTLPKRARPRASTPRSPQTSAGCYKGDLVPPLAGLAPASHRELSGRDLPRATRPGPRLRTFLGHPTLERAL